MKSPIQEEAWDWLKTEAENAKVQAAHYGELSPEEIEELDNEGHMDGVYADALCSYILHLEAQLGIR